MTVAEKHLPQSADTELEPAWEVAYLFPPQGYWSEAEFIRLDSSATRRIELVDGRIEVLAVPTELHQLIVAFFYKVLDRFVSERKLGLVLFTGLRVRLRPGEIREPDVVFMRAENAVRRSDDFWHGADLVMEVVSASAQDRKRDLEEKRRAYAQAGIPEYWILDPQQQRVLVLRLEGEQYVTHGEFKPGDRAPSATLPGFTLDVAAALRGEVDSL
jgi:Uma2 family endonuclease